MSFTRTSHVVPTTEDVGKIGFFAANSIPAGWLKADGSAVSRTTYAALFAKISTTYGVGDGSTTFNLPDLRGEFIRGFDDGKGTDAGRAMGSSQTDAMQGHWHQGYGGNGNTGSSPAYGSLSTVPITTNPSYPNTPISDGTNGTPPHGCRNETEERSPALLH